VVSVEEWFERIRKIIDSYFESIETALESFFTTSERTSGCLEPLHKVVETPSEVIVSFDLPGVDKSDISLRATETTVELRAEAKNVVRFRGLRGEEAITCKYYKIVYLPARVRPHMARAKFRNGVLEVRLPKKAAGYEIEIE